MNLMNNINELVKRCFTSLLIVACFGGAYLHSAMLFSFLLGSILAFILIIEWPRLIPIKKIKFLFLTLFYPVLPNLILIWLTLTFYDTDFYLPLYPFIVSWTADTMGYFTGKTIGRHKICPSISPGKSWEGLLGSIIGVSIVHLFLLPHISHFSYVLTFPYSINIILFSIMMTTIAFLGGLFMSCLKRMQGLKDAGDLLPGHGGLLDRFDSVFFVAIATGLLVLVK